MVSTSGIRGIVGSGLDPIMAAKYAAAYGTLLNGRKVVVGRDSRPSGQMLKMAVISALRSVGCDVIDIGIVPTPTVEIAVAGLKAAGGICLTASHNPSEWNALKLFNKKGEFIDKNDLARLNKIYNSEKLSFVGHKSLGGLESDNSWIDRHIKQVLRLDIINRNKIKRTKLKVVVDAVNGSGSYALPEMLEALGVEVIRLNCLGDGNFVHRPEPIPANLKMLSGAVRKFKADLGMACDPDADRLALVDEIGQPIGEELTLTLAVKYILSKKRGNIVINLSTSRATEDIAREAGARLYYTPVGEANVIAGIRKHRAVIGGEGNGGVIYPAFHCGRDALVGGAIISAFLAESKTKLSGLTGTLPIYYNIKTKSPLPAGFDRKMTQMKEAAQKSFKGLKVDKRDGLRFDFGGGWFQIRKSNTEPIYRLIVETNDRKLTRDIKNEIFRLLK